MIPAPTSERIQALDVLRGVAVAGILLGNVLVFFLFFMPPERAAALPTAAADQVVLFLQHVLVEGKFYSIFSLLFGIGFGLQLARGGEAVMPRFKRRLRILLAIGALHAVFIWSGDILMLYALLGFALPWFNRKSDPELLRWTVMLLALPVVLYLIGLGVWTLAGAGEGTSAATAPPAGIMALIEAMGTGGVQDAFLGNLVTVAGRWVDLFLTVRFPKVLAMFVLGLWVVRSGLVASLATHRATLVRWVKLGVGVGLPANVVAAWALHHWSYLPPSLGALLGVAMQAIGFPILALGYAAAVGLLVVDGRRLVAVFAPVGRMALTNYLMHSVVCILLSREFGFGLWWRIGVVQAMGIAVAIIVVQVPLSAWWLSRSRYGPIEWVWRRLTYARPL